jgi:hypothetical protein
VNEHIRNKEAFEYRVESLETQIHKILWLDFVRKNFRFLAKTSNTEKLELTSR